MSMYCYVLRVPDVIAKKIGKNNGLWDSVCWQASEAHDVLEYERQLASMSETDRTQAIARREAKMSGELGRLLKASIARNESKHARAKGLVPAPALCLDKAQSVLDNGLFAVGVSDGLLAGANVGKDNGYGQAWLRSVEETAQFAALLNRHTPSDIIAQIDPSDAAKIAWTPEGPPGQLFAELLEEHYPRLRQYLNEAQRGGDRLLVWIT